MSNYTTLKTTINANIRQNGNQEITGKILNSVLNAMVNTLGEGYQFAGIATTKIDPGTSDAKVFYIAKGKGTYTNFGGLEVTEDEVVFLVWDKAWHKVATGIAADAKLKEAVTELTEIAGKVDTKQDTIPDLDAIREGAGKGNEASSTIASIVEAGYVFAGIATPETNPGTPDTKVFYIANGKGTYTSFSGIEVTEDEVVVLCWDSLWNKVSTGIASQEKLSELEGIVEGMNDVLQMREGGLIEVGSVTGTKSNTWVFVDCDINVGDKFLLNVSGMTNLKYGNLQIMTYRTSGETTGLLEEVYVKNAPQEAATLKLEFTATQTAQRFAFNYYYSGATLKISRVVSGSSATIDDIYDNIDELRKSNPTGSSAPLNLTTEPMMLDMIEAVNGSDSYMPTTIEKYDVVSSGANYIELSATDAAKCTSVYLFLTVRYADETYKNVWFQSPTVNNRLYITDFEEADMTGASSVMGAFDTPVGGKGLHQSSYGCRSYAKYVADFIKRTSFKGFNYLGGLTFSELAMTANFNDINIYDTSGNVVCTPVKSSGWNVARGYVNKVQNNSTGVFGWSQQAYVASEQTNGNYIEFPMSFSGKRGYLEIVAATRKRTSTDMTLQTNRGDYKAEVYQKGEKITEFILKTAIKRYVVDNISLDNVAVRFVSMVESGQDSPFLCVYNIHAYELDAMAGAPSYGKYSKVAVLGDSWTQFPQTNQPTSQGIVDDASFVDDCKLVVRPDGTEGNGFGFFPKQLARELNCKVDNWGKSDQTTENWGVPNIDKVLTHDNYDAVIIEFFLNDNKYGLTFDEWKSNLRAMALKCIRRGVRPIILMPNKAASGSAIDWLEGIREGFGDMVSW